MKRLIVPALFLPCWSDTRVRHEDINIKTGQARFTEYSMLEAEEDADRMKKATPR